jgi:hypothetical protein
MASLWIILILPAIALAADQQQRTTVNLGSNPGVSPQQQLQQPMSNNMQPAGQGVNIADPSYSNPNGANNNNMAAYYRNLDLQQGGQGAVYPPEVPNFYFNAGFNKGESLDESNSNFKKYTVYIEYRRTNDVINNNPFWISR